MKVKEIMIRGKRFVSVTTAAAILEIRPDLLRLYIRKGVFKTAKKLRGTRWVIRRKEVEQIKEKGLDVKGLFSEEKEA